MTDLHHPAVTLLALLALTRGVAFGVDEPDVTAVPTQPAISAPADSSARADSSSSDRRPATATAPVDPTTAWKGWMDIARAIAPDPLDGPGDILEKEEIIQDRVDDLAAEEERLARTGSQWQGRHQAASVQLEVLDDLAEIQLGGDLQLQQRLENVREDIRMADEWQRRIDESRRELATEMKRLRILAREYRNRAEELRRQEEGPR